jgi:hypothetical protein
MLVALYKPTVRLFILAAARHFSQLAPSTRNELSSTQTNRNHLLAEKSNLDNPPINVVSQRQSTNKFKFSRCSLRIRHNTPSADVN